MEKTLEGSNKTSEHAQIAGFRNPLCYTCASTSCSPKIFKSCLVNVPLVKGMATHSSVLAWKISRTEEPGGLQSTGSQRVGHDWAHTRPEMSPNSPFRS